MNKSYAFDQAADIVKPFADLLDGHQEMQLKSRIMEALLDSYMGGYDHAVNVLNDNRGVKIQTNVKS